MNPVSNPVTVSQRNYGIDLLRLVAAFYVIILHIMNRGGLYSATTEYSYQNLLCRIMLIVTYCAVNIFGIISGYVGYREPLKKISYNGYLTLWMTVVFYNLLFVGIYMFLLPGSVTKEDVISVFFPVSSNLYWYFSAFTLVTFFAPFLNRVLYTSSEKELKLLFLLICCVFTIIEFLKGSFEMNQGYSAHWLILLYLVGGIMKKTKIGSRISAPTAILWIILLYLTLFFLDQKVRILYYPPFIINFDCKRSYITPFYLAVAILHVILFAKFQFHPFFRKLIAFAAPAAFSVYITNTNPLFWKHFMKDRFVSWSTSSPAGIFVRTIAFSGFFVLAVIFLDFLRQKLFRLIGVHNWSQKLSGLFHNEKIS